MFCPRCGSTQSEELKFCKACGANLHAVRQVVDTRDAGENFDLSKTWVAEMFMSGEEATRRKLEMERRQGITPAVKRYQEIKAGVITTSVGLAVSAIVFVVMNGIILSGEVSSSAAELLSRLWIVGLLPILVGLALIINGFFISRKIVELTKQQDQLGGTTTLEKEPPQLRSADTTEFVPAQTSVTEHTTKHLGAPPQG